MMLRGQAAFTFGSKDGRPERAQGPTQCIRAILDQRRAQKSAALLGERERHPSARKDEPGAGAAHAIARVAQAPAAPGGARHGAAGDVRQLIGEERDEQAHLVAGGGVEHFRADPRRAAAPVALRPVCQPLGASLDAERLVEAEGDGP